MIDKAALLKAALDEQVVEIDGRGPVRVRSLTRLEAIKLQNPATTPEQAEIWALAWGLVDPALSEEEAAAALNAGPPGELQPVVSAIMELSGLQEGAQKSDRARSHDRRR